MAFDGTKPSGSDTGANFASSANANDLALRDMVVTGGDGSLAWSYSQSGADPFRPVTITLANGTQRERWALTWSGNDITQITASYSPNSGTSWTTLGVFTYSVSGANVTGGNVGSMLLARLVALTSLTYTNNGSIAGHIATGTGAHGIGSLAAQNANSVAITGGSIADVSLQYIVARGRTVNLGNISGATYIDLNAGDVFYGTVVGNTQFYLLNVISGAAPNPAGSFTLELTNPGAYSVVWPSGTLWPGGIAPTRTASGVDLYEFYIRNAVTRGAQAQKDSR